MEVLVRATAMQSGIANALLGLFWLVGHTNLPAEQVVMTSRMRKQFAAIESDLAVPDFVYTDVDGSDMSAWYERGMSEGFQLIRDLLLEMFPDGEPLGTGYIDRLVWRIGLQRLPRPEVLALAPGDRVSHISGSGPSRLESDGTVESVTPTQILIRINTLQHAGRYVTVKEGSSIEVPLTDLYRRVSQFLLINPRQIAPRHT